MESVSVQLSGHIESERTEVDTTPITILLDFRNLCLLTYIVELMMILITIISIISNK